MKLFTLLLTTGLLSATSLMAKPQEPITPLEREIRIETQRQARSIHCGYAGLPTSNLIYIEAEVQSTAPGSYFCLMGFNVGYMGIQELGNGKRKGIFSIWEPGNPQDASANPNKVAQQEQTQVLYQGVNVEVSRFGGEGTGGKSMFDLDWQVGERIRMAVESHALPAGRSAYTGWIYDNKLAAWKRIATFSTLAARGNPTLSGSHSFVEDFKRNYASKKEVRQATFYTPSAYAKGKWHQSTAATFTGDRNRSMNIDAGPVAGGYFLKTGGETKNITTPLWGKMVPLTAEKQPANTIRDQLLKEIERINKATPAQ